MSTAPNYHRFRLVYPNDALVFQDNDKLPISTLQVDKASAVAIGPGSEVDCCQIKHRDGFATIAVGAPLIGSELRGPFHVLPFAGRVPGNYNAFDQGFCGARSDALPPLVEIITYPVGCAELVTTLGNRRAPATRSGLSMSVGAAYVNSQPLDVFPAYGRRRCTITLTVTTKGNQDLKVQIVGLRQRTSFSSGVGNYRDSLDCCVSKTPAGGNEFFQSTDRTPIILDSAGDKEITIATATFQTDPFEGCISFDLEGSSFIAYAIYAKTAGTAWVVIPTFEAHDA